MIMTTFSGLFVMIAAVSFIFRNFYRKKYLEVEVLKLENQELVASINIMKVDYVELTKENKSMNQITRLVQQSPNAIMMMDKEGNVLSTNHGFTNMYEYSYNDFIKARGNNYRRTSFSPKVLERIDLIMKTKKPVKYEALNITKSGKELWTQTALTPIIDSNGNIDGMATIDTDIHNRIVSSDKLIEKMESIYQHIDTMSNQFKLLESETRTLFESINQLQSLITQTDQIVRFIKEISDKTKILGINASIEANIAGSYGRGFRVVANEIVDISNQTINSVSKINQLLSSVSTNQEQLLKEKEVSEGAIESYQNMINTLKKEILEVENAIENFKTLT